MVGISGPSNELSQAQYWCYISKDTNVKVFSIKQNL